MPHMVGQPLFQTMKMELPTTPIQELIKSIGNQIPERYISRHPDKDLNSEALEWIDCPIFDAQLLLDTSSSNGQEELKKFLSVLKSWGCFQVINHGIPSSKLDQLRKVGKEFFELPLEEKQKYSRTLTSYEGYGSDSFSKSEPFNWNDKLHLKVLPVGQRNLKLWPQTLPNFSEILDECSIGMKRVADFILQAIGRSLNLDENIFLNQFGEDGIMFARFNYYPLCPYPDQVHGLKPHCDATILSILLQDKEVEGLQVFKDDKWFKVPLVPDAFFILTGDQLEIMSNGLFKSVKHKVVISKEKERMSMGVGTYPSADKETIGPIRELIDEQRPQMYKDVKNYMDLYSHYIQRGERSINVVKIQG